MRLLSIALNTFKESIRNKILIGVLLFSVLIIISTMVLVQLTIGQWMKITVDIGLGAISLFGNLMAVFLGINLVAKEIDRKTVYTIVSKPIKRYEFILSKYIGLILTIFINVVLMLIILLIILKFYVRYEIPYLGTIQAFYLLILEFMIISSVAIFFSTFSTPIMSAAFSLTIWLIGHLLSDLKFWSMKSENEGFRILINTAYYLLPDLELLNLKSNIVYQITADANYIFWVSAYSLMYSIVMLTVSILIFEKRDFK
ncbi:MAG: ABC transporter permease [Deltaproteobacteria bacterium]|nr:ABC transporter permease [Deltaproteobacteria bacterium]